MIGTLLRKELRQHWLVLLLLPTLALAGYGLVLAANLSSGETGSVFESFRIFVIFFVISSGLALCHRLVVTEYAAKTQLFLEALPVTRWRMVAVKYVLGLGLMLGIVVITLTLACLIGQRNEALTPRFIGILSTRVFSVALVAYNLFFAMGFLGRYRMALYLIGLFACFAIGEMTDIELKRFGPFALLDERFPYESETFPWDALWTTWTLSAVFLLLASALSLTREGTVAALLAEKMSHREKVFIAAFLVGMVFAFSVLDEKKKREPFDLQEAITETRGGVTTKVALRGAKEDPEARRIARFVADELAAAREYLGLSALPPVFVTERRDLDANRYERGELERASGVHVQANFSAPDFQLENFSAWLVREVLIAHSDGRAKLESKMWVLDGFALFHGARERAAAPLTEDKTLALRALYGVGASFTPSDLRHWHSFRERVGQEIAAGVAWSGLKTLVRRRGDEACRQFVRSALAVPPKDFRALRHERSTPVERLLQTEAGVSFESFWAQWEKEIASARHELAFELTQIPKLTGELEFVPLSANSRKMRYRLRLEGTDADARYSFLYCPLPAFDEEVLPQSIRREQHSFASQSEGELPESWARGGRLYWTFALDVPALGCPVVSGWKREEIR